jgi:hypothetical protein
VPPAPRPHGSRWRRRRISTGEHWGLKSG